LGATGSIGKSALDIISRDTENFEVVLLTAASNRQKMEGLKARFPGAVCALALDGEEKMIAAIKNANADITINGISGAAGLMPSLAAIESGSNLALANKETVVMAGKLAFDLAREKGVEIIPVDSEHSAVFHLMKSFSPRRQEENTVSEIVLTASGGAFRDLSLEEMSSVTVKDALAHPTWDMGPKITIDSASMANKGLEIIEACVFFDMPAQKVKVVIHPQSIVHSMIRLCNGVFYAQLSKPDMRHPIHDALYWPCTAPSALEPVSFDSLTLEFYKPDLNKYPMLSLAWEAAKRGALYPCAYNAANEQAVAAFLEQKISFLDIPKIVSRTLEADWSCEKPCLETILKADKDARQRANTGISRQADYVKDVR